ncbi:MAG: helix-turn-helix transcriptional regulator [Treponema sp.]|nr:helix-turn-helix transcriptional regulator [Treponema sp.]
MDENNIDNKKIFLTAAQLSALTPREHDILKMLFNGDSCKEIAYSLNISYNTIKTHKRNLYRKLGISRANELVLKYSSLQEYARHTETPKPAVFTRWIVNVDELGSYVNITEKVEFIEEHFFTTVTIEGKLSHKNHAYAGTHAYPDPCAIEAMKKMKSFSFKVLGDGNSYAVMIPTTDTRLRGDNNHYRKTFTTKNGEIQIITVNIDELFQSPYWGTPVPFIQSNTDFFQIHAHATRLFVLKFWDIKFYTD